MPKRMRIRAPARAPTQAPMTVPIEMLELADDDGVDDVEAEVVGVEELVEGVNTITGVLMAAEFRVVARDAVGALVATAREEAVAVPVAVTAPLVIPGS
jgi:hypothetical protein